MATEEDSSQGLQSPCCGLSAVTQRFTVTAQLGVKGQRVQSIRSQKCEVEVSASLVAEC